MHASTRGGVAAPPQRAQAHNNACALTRSPAGSHTLSMRVRMGKHPASPAPNRKRMIHRERTFQAAPVKAVNTDQPNTICSKTRRTPIRSPNNPIGISNRAYERPNAPKTRPICALLRCRSWEMGPAACEIATRCTYDRTASPIARATTLYRVRLAFIRRPHIAAKSPPGQGTSKNTYSASSPASQLVTIAGERHSKSENALVYGCGC
jgi:hypothetical protein